MLNFRYQISDTAKGHEVGKCRYWRYVALNQKSVCFKHSYSVHNLTCQTFTFPNLCWKYRMFKTYRSFCVFMLRFVEVAGCFDTFSSVALDYTTKKIAKKPFRARSWIWSTERSTFPPLILLLDRLLFHILIRKKRNVIIGWFCKTLLLFLSSSNVWWHL